jgi:signal transduction histidine kinase/integral membrane sensor domain MASE1
MFLSPDKFERSFLRPEHWWGKALIFLSIASLYFVLGYFGLSLATINKNASPIWPASGFAVGALLVCGLRNAPAIFLGSFLVNFSVETPLVGMAGAALGNMLEALVASMLITYGLRKNFFKHYSEFFTIIIGSISASVISASIGVFSLNMIGIIPDESFFYAWYTWWSGNAIGILLVLPLFLEFASSEEKIQIDFKKIIYGICLFAIKSLCIYLVFVKGFNQAFAWSLSPFFILSGMILGRMYSRFILIFFAFVITALTATGYGPFEHGNTNANLIYVQTLLASYAFAILFVKPLNTGYKISSKYLIGIGFGWLSMFLIIFMTSSYEKDHTLDDFHKSADTVVQSLTRLSGRYEALVKGASALFRVSEKVTAEEWKIYVDSIELPKYFDAVYGLGFVELVSKSDLASYEKANNIKVKIIDPSVAAQYDHHFILKYIEPLEKNDKAIGLDVGSETSRRFAIKKALEFMEPRASANLDLVQEEENRPGFIVIYPVVDRDNKLKGFINAPVISSIFFGKYLEQFSHNLRVRVSSGGHLIHHMDKYPKAPFKQNIYYDSRKVTIFGRNHRIEFYPSENFFALHSGSSAALALLLNVFMLFIGAFLLEQLTFSQKAEELVNQRTKELEISKIQLINSSKMASLGEMASGMAHEINNPLAIIQGKVKVLSMMLEDLQISQPSVFTEIHKIKLTTDRIDKIVKGLRNFSRASNNDPFEPVLLQKLLDETLDLCSEKFKAHGIDLRIKSIPEVHILCRPSQISQVFINLLNNSSDAIEEMKEKWIEIDFKKENNKVCIFFTDSGPGIPEDIAMRIMEPFFTTKEVRKGTGLGLSIAKSIVETHRGSLWLDHNVSHTRFVIEFLTQS